MTSLPLHTLLQSSVSFSLLLTLLCHIFLLFFSKPSTCHTDPISSCVLTYYFTYSVLPLHASHTQSYAFLLFYSLWSSHSRSRAAYFNPTLLSPSHQVLQYYTEVSTLWVFNPNFSKHLCLCSPMTSSHHWSASHGPPHPRRSYNMMWQCLLTLICGCFNEGTVKSMLSMACGYHCTFAVAEQSLLSLKILSVWKMATEPVSLEISSTSSNRIWFKKR